MQDSQVLLNRLIPDPKDLKWVLQGEESWSLGYFASKVGKHGDDETIAKCVKKQENNYLYLYRISS